MINVKSGSETITLLIKKMPEWIAKLHHHMDAVLEAGLEVDHAELMMVLESTFTLMMEKTLQESKGTVDANSVGIGELKEAVGALKISSTFRAGPR